MHAVALGSDASLNCTPKKHDLLAIGAAIDVTKEVLDTVFPDERIAFNIEVNISFGGLWKQAQADAINNWQKLILNDARFSGRDLNTRLLTHPIIRER